MVYRPVGAKHGGLIVLDFHGNLGYNQIKVLLDSSKMERAFRSQQGSP